MLVKSKEARLGFFYFMLYTLGRMRGSDGVIIGFTWILGYGIISTKGDDRMIANYIIGGVCILISVLIPIFYYMFVRKAVRVNAEIVEQISFDNLLGQKNAWIISFNDDGSVIRRLFNTVYKSEKTKPKVGNQVLLSKVIVFGKTRYITKFQISAGVLLIVCQFILFWILAFIAFGIIV